MRAVVTGGAGFIGSHVVDALLARGDEVHVVDNLSTGQPRVPGRGGDAARARHPRAARGALRGIRPEVVFHLAAQADVGDVRGAARLRRRGERRRHDQRARGGAEPSARRSSSARREARSTATCERPAAEDDPRRAGLAVRHAKLAAEEYVATWNRLPRDEPVVLRFANVYGPRQDCRTRGGVVSIFLDRLARGEAPRSSATASSRATTSTSATSSHAMLAAVGQAGGVFNVGTGIETSVNDLLRGLPRRRGRRGRGRARAGSRRRAQRSVLDPSLACERELGWRPADAARRRALRDLALR